MSTRSRLHIAVLTAAVLAAVIAWPARASKPADAEKDGWKITVAPDRVSGVYRAGEQITFHIGLTHGGRPAQGLDVSYEIEVNGAKAPAPATAVTGPEGAAVRTQMDAPGCLMITARYKLPGGAEIHIETGAAVDPEDIRPGLPAPDDFDEFWAAQSKLLAAMPMNPRLTPVEAEERVIGDGEAFDVQLDCPGGAPVSGYFARPRGAKPKSLQAWISFHGAGVRSSSLRTAAARARGGRLGMDINAHGLPNGKPPEFYTNLLRGDLRGYPTFGIESRDTAYLRGMYLRLMRAIEFLTAQPEWDGRTLIVSGSSQGGAQALIAAGLDERVTLVSASLPALCDLGATAAGRPAGWPIGRGRLTDQQRETLRYFDVVNFAARTKATAFVRVGLVDRTCWPTGVFAACNALKGEKHLMITPASGHGYTAPQVYRDFSAQFGELIEKDIEARQAAE